VELFALYIMTARLNLDYLENLFSQIRGLGGQIRDPTVLDFKYRIKKVLRPESTDTWYNVSESRRRGDHVVRKDILSDVK
jgi:hypothetical protein